MAAFRSGSLRISSGIVVTVLRGRFAEGAAVRGTLLAWTLFVGLRQALVIERD
jgi:Rad3-related DNA helicase